MTVRVAKATAAALAVGAVAFGVWQVRSVLILDQNVIAGTHTGQAAGIRDSLLSSFQVGSILVLAVGLPQSLHVAALSLLWLVVIREFQSYVVNPHIGRTVGLSPLVTLLSVAVVGVLFGGLAVILAVPFTSAVATLIDVLVFGHEPPTEQPRRSLRLRRSG